MKKIQKIEKNLITLVFILSIFLALSSLNVTAAEKIDINRKGSLKIIYQPKFTDALKSKFTDTQFEALKEQLNSKEVEYKIYRVASVEENGVFTVVSPFEDNVEINNFDDWAELAATLEGYVTSKNISPTKSGITANKTIIFDNLEVGAYLVLGEDIEILAEGYDGFIKFEQRAYLLSIPTEMNGELYYNVESNPKHNVLDPSKKKIDIKVLKVWYDNGNKRPDSIDVNLLKDGKIEETIKLSADNNWAYKWEDLDGDFTWTVSEPNVPNGYAVLIEDKKGITYKLVNTYTTTRPYYTRTTSTTKTTKPNESTSGGTESTTVVTTTEPDTEITSESVPRGNETTVPTTPKDEIPDEPIPQAGMLWWPVPVLLCAGVIMFIIGIIKKSRAE